jgi:hypothetical protein
MRWGVPKQKRHCAAYGGISHQVIIVQKPKDFVIDVGQVIYQHRHDRMGMEQQAVSPLARMWLGEAPIGLMIEVMRVPEVEVADLRSPFRRPRRTRALWASIGTQRSADRRVLR